MGISLKFPKKTFILSAMDNFNLLYSLVPAHTQNAADNDISCEVHTNSSGLPVIL